MPDARMRWALVVICLICLAGSGAMLYAGHRSAPPIIITPPTAAPPILQARETVPNLPSGPESQARATTAAPQTAIYVHVAGAVRKPSLYRLAPGSRLMRAITAAGGPTPQADMDAVNLAEKVVDGEKVYIPLKAGRASAPILSKPPASPPGNALGRRTIKPVIIQSPALSTTGSPAKVKVVRGLSSAASDSTNDSHDAPSKLRSAADGQINVNTATQQEFERLPGIGPAMAKRILEYRRKAGGFRKIEDLQEVPGIGEKKFAKVKTLVIAP